MAMHFLKTLYFDSFKFQWRWFSIGQSRINFERFRWWFGATSDKVLSEPMLGYVCHSIDVILQIRNWLMTLRSWYTAFDKNFPTSDVMMDRLVIATQEDLTMQRLNQVIGHGWPEKCSSLPADLESFWNIRDELTCGDGLVYAGQKLIVPTAMRKEFLEVLHESHQGIDKTRARARGVIYWPGINRDISDMIERCATCLRFARSNSKEPLIPHPVPDGPFQHIAMDILTYAGRDYLVAVDCYSKYPELARIEYKTAECVIAHVKGICARHGIPTIIYADNQPFNSRAFINFANSWGITVTTSSPGFP